MCWEKFARYFEVELKEVKLKEGFYVMDPMKAVEMVDENSICVATILGSTLNGEFKDVKLLNELLMQKNRRTGRDTPIHVDAVSSRFIAPFLYPDLEWDFKLPLVKSINVSGHKYGLVYAGIGWVIWRNKEDFPEELIYHINYLGADQPTFTLNFLKGSSQIIAQYYQFLCLGFKAAMEKFSTKIISMIKVESLYEWQGGPIILSQIENEFGSPVYDQGELAKMSSTLPIALNADISGKACVFLFASTLIPFVFSCSNHLLNLINNGGNIAWIAHKDQNARYRQSLISTPNDHGFKCQKKHGRCS